MITIAIAQEFKVNLLDQAGVAKPQLTSMLNSQRRILTPRLRYVRFLRPITTVRITTRDENIPQAQIIRHDLFKEGRRIWVDHHVLLGPTPTTLSASQDYSIEPFKKSGRITGNWRVRVLVAQFPRSIFQTLTPAQRNTVFEKITFAVVLNGELSWTVADETGLNDLDATGQYRSRQTAEAVLDSQETYRIDQI